MIQELTFTGEIKGKNCAICKKPLKKSDEVLACPYCDAVFHKEHLYDWLKEIPACPVCEEDYSEILEKHPKELLRTEPEKYTGYTLTNDVTVASLVFVRVLLTIFGFLFAFPPNIVFSLTSPLDRLIKLNIFILLFSLIGMAIIYFGNKKLQKDITNLWEKMILTKDKIVFTSEKVENVEFWPGDIRKIESRPHRVSKDEAPDEFSVPFRVYTTQKKVYDFGSIFQSQDRNLAWKVYRELRYRIRYFYDILIDERRKPVSTHLKQFFKNNWSFFVIAIAIHLGINALGFVIQTFLF
ncbi:MAG: hypothetical protein GF308_19530 [Candidatus Heimdallarchaeota archaeon]|nr:hypothetical protein [Candidatus Heimdallarchaeota archaeon]